MTYNGGWGFDIINTLGDIGRNIGGGLRQGKIGSALEELGPDASWESRAQAVMQLDPRLGTRLLEMGGGDELPSEVRAAQYFGSLPKGHPELEYAPRNSNQRTLPRIAINDLTKYGTSVEDTTRLSDTFKDEYGGWKVNTVGEAANYAARNLGVGNTEAATWWQDYQNFSNVARNALFGSALTAQEKAQWDRANIQPGMTPKAIRDNLKLRKDASMRAARKLSRAYGKSGYDKAAIEEAVGFGLDDDATAPATSTQPPPEAPVGEDEIQQSLENAKAAIQKNPAIREKVIQRLMEAGIDASGL
jgi:hypothetical protein